MPKPNVNVDIVPGCNILRNQFAVANYSGPLPCTLPGQAAPAPSSAAGGRRLMQAAYQNTNTSAPCEVRQVVPPLFLLDGMLSNILAIYRQVRLIFKMTFHAQYVWILEQDCQGCSCQ